MIGFKSLSDDMSDKWYYKHTVKDQRAGGYKFENHLGIGDFLVLLGPWCTEKGNFLKHVYSFVLYNIDEGFLFSMCLYSPSIMFAFQLRCKQEVNGP